MCAINHIRVHFTKGTHKNNCEHRIFTKTGSLKHYVRLSSNSRAVYTNLKEQGNSARNRTNVCFGTC